MKTLKILYLEDSPHDAEITSRLLKKSGLAFSLRLVDKPEEYQNALKQYEPDLILADHSLYQFNSVEALRMTRENNLDIPFILVTGTVSEEFAVNVLKEGADDYLLKDNLTRLPNAIHNALGRHLLEKEREQYLADVIANEALLKEAEHLAGFGSWQADLSNGRIKWSDEAYRIFGYEAGEIEPNFEKFLHHVHPEDMPSVKEDIEESIKSRNSYNHEFRIVDKCQRIKYINSKIVIDRNEDGIPTRLVGFNQDITERKEMEQELTRSVEEMAKLERELMEQQLREQKMITEITLEAQEKERQELGRELHDNINQILATIKMYLDIIKSNKNVPEGLAEKCYEHTNEVMEEIRKLSKTLVAPSLGNISLLEALKELVENSNISNELQIQLVDEMHDERLADNKMELMLYRIVQEQINNIRKHARAKEATIHIKASDDHLLLSIADNGMGFDPGQNASGIGLKNIRSRVEFYSGTLHIISGPNKGCTLKISVPL